MQDRSIVQLTKKNTQCALFRYGIQCNQTFRGTEEMKLTIHWGLIIINEGYNLALVNEKGMA